jgi:putative FmdB family regulatory protein
MPIYEYRCSQCDGLSEFFLRLSDPQPDECPKCRSLGSLKKQISQTSFSLKGEGWYVTDYKKPAAPVKDGDSSSTKGAIDATTSDAGSGASATPAADAAAPSSPTPSAPVTAPASGKDSSASSGTPAKSPVS